MGTWVGVGSSDHRNTAQAGREAATKAVEKAGIDRPDFVFVFATVGHNQEVLIQAVRACTGGAPLSGCSGEGVITHGVAAETNFHVAVMAIKSDEMRFDNVCIADGDINAETAGKHLAQEVSKVLRDDSIACFLFADGLTFDFEPLLRSLEQGIPHSHRLPIFGGLASDNWSSRRTYQYHNDRTISGGVSCVILSGSGKVAWGVNHGCTPIGIKRVVTRSRANVIYEIDGIPALEALKDYFEEDVTSQWNKLSLNLCLGFKTPENLRDVYDEYVIRYMMAKNDEEGSVTIQSDVEDGTELWIVRRDKELMRSGLEEISQRIVTMTGGKRPKLVLQFECVGRGKVVFREQEKLELLNHLQSTVGAEVPWIGFYTYGEIAPISTCNFLHNFSAVITAIY